MTIVWRYLASGEVKHQMRDDKTRRAVCGFEPWMQRWQSDRATLVRLPECRLCARLVTL